MKGWESVVNESVLWERACELMPRGTQTMSKCPDQFVDGIYPKFASRGDGVYIECLDGKTYLDFMCALGPMILGYNNIKVNKAIIEQLNNGIIFSLPTTLEAEMSTSTRKSSAFGPSPELFLTKL